MHFSSANAKVCGLHYWFFFSYEIPLLSREEISECKICLQTAFLKGILTTMLDSFLFNINSMTYNSQGLLSTASTVKNNNNNKNPNQQKKTNQNKKHFLQWHWVLMCKKLFKKIDCKCSKKLKHTWQCCILITH